MTGDQLRHGPTAGAASGPFFPSLGVDVALRGGATIHMRAVRVKDAEPLRVLLAGLSVEERYLRFFSSGVNLARAARDFTRQGIGLGLIATTGEAEQVVGHGAYVREAGPVDRAEVAFAVAHDWQKRGLATTLLRELAGAAAAEGVRTFTALMLPANHRMIGIFRRSGFVVEVHAGGGALEVTFPTTPTPGGAVRFSERWR